MHTPHPRPFRRRAGRRPEIRSASRRPPYQGHKRPKTPERPITFNAAEDLGTFELAQLWADRTAWPLSDRTAYDELAELATMSALAKWLTRWQPIAIHSAVLAGARMESIAGSLGNSLQVAFDRWHEWATKQRDFIINGRPGITEDESWKLQAVAWAKARVGVVGAGDAACFGVLADHVVGLPAGDVHEVIGGTARG